MDAVRIFQRRLLFALEQTAVATLPPGWDRLEPTSPANLRAAARIVGRVTELPDRAAMAGRLRAIAEESRENRGDREGEERLWQRLAERVEGLRDRPDGAPDDLASLRLWQGWPPWDGLQSPLDGLRHDLDGLLPQDLPPGEALLGGAASVLLRALARRWVSRAKELDDARQASIGREEAASP